MEIGDATLEPVSVLPCQLGDAFLGGARIQSEKRLQLAVLAEAIGTFLRWAGVERPGAVRRFAEVEIWFASDDAEGPFAFVAICDSLGFDPAYIRGGLRHWCAGVKGTATRALDHRRARLKRGPHPSDAPRLLDFLLCKARTARPTEWKERGQ